MVYKIKLEPIKDKRKSFYGKASVREKRWKM